MRSFCQATCSEPSPRPLLPTFLPLCPRSSAAVPDWLPPWTGYANATLCGSNAPSPLLAASMASGLAPTPCAPCVYNPVPADGDEAVTAWRFDQDNQCWMQVPYGLERGSWVQLSSQEQCAACHCMAVGTCFAMNTGIIVVCAASTCLPAGHAPRAGVPAGRQRRGARTGRRAAVAPEAVCRFPG